MEIDLNATPNASSQEIAILVDFIKNTNKISEATALAIAKNFIPITFKKNEFIYHVCCLLKYRKV